MPRPAGGTSCLTEQQQKGKTEAMVRLCRVLSLP